MTTRRERNLIRLYDAIGEGVGALVVTADAALQVPGRVVRRAAALLDPDLAVCRFSRLTDTDTT